MSLIGLPPPPRLTTRAVYPYRGAVTSRASSARSWSAPHCPRALPAGIDFARET